jgi:hypothetical protein
MATKVPTFKFQGPKAPKIVIATKEEKEEFKAKQDQTTDITALVRQPETTVPVPDLSTGLAKPTFGQAKAKPKQVPLVPKSKMPVEKPPTEEKPTVPSGDIEAEIADYKEDSELQTHAREILTSEYENPYEDKSLAPVYPLQSRMGFQQEILKVFQRFMKTGKEAFTEPDYDACKKMAAGMAQQVEMYQYQKFVREYIRQASPYRGVLVYHGLGSGKTCTAIAAAEALLGVSKKQIIVMTPSSLRDNFIREMTFCGFRHFRLQNFWVSLNGSDALVQTFAKDVLGLDKEYMKNGPAIWVPDFSQPEPNFNTLTSAERQQITQQVIFQIKSRVKFINYNGISATRLKQIACKDPDKDGYGYFDNKVIVIDEIHNLTRLMQGTIDPYIKHLPGFKRKIQFEPIKPGHWTPALCSKHFDPTQKALTNYHRGYLFYRLLATARNSKIIGLSGTPLINFPEELGILTNLLGGYIHTASFTIKEGTKQNKLAVEQILKDNPFIDFEEVSMTGSALSVMFTLVPEGMTKVMKDGVLGIQQLPVDETSPTIQQVATEIVKLLSSNKLTIMKEPEYNSEPLLPPIGEDFRKDFLEDNGYDLKNEVVLRKRLQGLISYYRGSKKELMPEVIRDEVVFVPFSPYAQAEYMRVRNEELDVQMEKKKKADGTVPGLGTRATDLWAQIYELTTGKGSASYRMSSRQACNFSFPEGIVRPRPRDMFEVEKEITDETVILQDEVTEREAIDALPIPKDEDEEDDVEAAKKEDEELDVVTKQAAIEEARKNGDDDQADALEKEDNAKVIPTMEPQGQVGDLQPAVKATDPPKTLSEKNKQVEEQKKLKADCAVGILKDEKYGYELATRRAKKCLETFGSQILRLYSLNKKIFDAATRGLTDVVGTPPVPTQLAKYSPKFVKIIENILTSPGSSLVYSQFLDMEGIGIFLIALMKNEFDPIVIEGDPKTGLFFSKSTIDSFTKRPHRFRFLSFTGGEHPAVRSMALRIFNAKFSNGSFTELPPDMSKTLVDAGFTGNTMGELCRVFCITSAGAEGLSLRNVRRVHIMEPYWNHVRTDQVKGRAVRICSHVDLEYSTNPAENQRTVEVFTYCSVFDKEALVQYDGTGRFPKIDETILNQDGFSEKEAIEQGFDFPKGAKAYVATSDEYLLTLSQKKKKVLENIQNVMKTSAVDCEINVIDNQDDGLGCIRLGGTPNQYAYHPVLAKDIAITATEFVEAKPTMKHVDDVRFDTMAKSSKPVVQIQKPKMLKALELSYKGKPYILFPFTDEFSGTILHFDLYDVNDITRVNKLGEVQADAQGNPIPPVRFFKV